LSIFFGRKGSTGPRKENYMNKKLTILAVVALVAGFIVLGGGQAQAIHLVCGQTILANTTLDEDLTCTDTPGLIIGADGITVDLNGFTLSGAPCSKCHGIRNGDLGTSDSFNNVRVEGGTIVGFEQGIRPEGSPLGTEINGFTVKDVTLSGQTSSHAIDVLDAKKVDITDVLIILTSIAAGAPEGIRLESVDGAKVDNVVVDGGAVGVNFACGDCTGTEAPTNGQIKNSIFTNNGNGILLARTTKAKVKKNVVSGSGGTGILVGLGFLTDFPSITNVKLSGNVVSGSGGNGILLVKTTNSKVSKNTLTSNANRGISLILDSTGNEIEENRAIGNTVDDLAHDGGSTGNDWEDNTCITSFGGDIDCP